MYLPAHFEENRLDVLHRLLRAYPLGFLVTMQNGELNANHIPFEISPSEGRFGTLRAHVARANPVWREVNSDVDALVVFQGAQTYVTPSWYVTKQRTGMVVPTFNYLAVHAYGPLRVIEDRAWLRGLVERLTQKFEGVRAAPWAVSDAPAPFIEKQLEAIVGLEIPVAKLIGKWKASQNRPADDQQGVIHGLLEDGGEQALEMAAVIAARTDP